MVPQEHVASLPRPLPLHTHLGLHRRGQKVIAEARAPGRHVLIAGSQKEVPGPCQRTDHLDHAAGPLDRIFRGVLEPTWAGREGVR